MTFDTQFDMQSSEISPMQEYIVGSRGSTQYTQSWLLSEIERIGSLN